MPPFFNGGIPVTKMPSTNLPPRWRSATPPSTPLLLRFHLVRLVPPLLQHRKLPAQRLVFIPKLLRPPAHVLLLRRKVDQVRVQVGRTQLPHLRHRHPRIKLVTPFHPR